MIPSDIFRSYDIRGKVGKEVNEEVALRLGKAFGAFVLENGGKRVYIGHDSRPSSPALAEAFAAGLAGTGCDTFGMGMVPTPALYFASVQDEGSYGAVITASHLPANTNGFKFCRGTQTIYTEINGRIKELALGETFPQGQGKRQTAVELIRAYEDNLLSCIKSGSRRLKVVLDCQNGAASLLAPALFEKLNLDLEKLHCDPSQPYPFERPDPQVATNLMPLVERVRQTRADVGIAFDGDADRLGVVDDRGQQIPIDRFLALIAGELLKSNPGAKVVYDVLCSQVLVSEVEKHGGKALGCRSGHAFVKEMLVEENALLGGELSGHIFFADRYQGFDDGIYAALRLIELLSNNNQPLSALMAAMPSLFASPEDRPHCPDAHKKAIVAEMESIFRSAGYPLITVDGVRIQFPNGWGIIRPSGTEPALSMRVEAASEAEMKSYHALLWEKLIAAGKRLGVDLSKSEH